jgi:hypothetical protein
VKWLRIIFAREFEHFLAGDIVMAEQGFGTDFAIFEIDHGHFIAALASQGKWQYETFVRRLADGEAAV